MDKQELKNIIERLVKFSDDPEELQLWYDIFEHLEPEEQEKLLDNLTLELKELEKNS